MTGKSRAPRRINWAEQPLGRVRDAELASQLGVTPASVYCARRKLGIASGFTNRKGIDWSQVDFARPASEVAQELGVAVNSVYEAMRRRIQGRQVNKLPKHEHTTCCICGTQGPEVADSKLGPACPVCVQPFCECGQIKAQRGRGFDKTCQGCSEPTDISTLGSCLLAELRVASRELTAEDLASRLGYSVGSGKGTGRFCHVVRDAISELLAKGLLKRQYRDDGTGDWLESSGVATFSLPRAQAA